jgi:rubredoxin
MSAQGMGGYRCNVCGMIFNSLGDLDAHTREKHNTASTTTWQ